MQCFITITYSSNESINESLYRFIRFLFPYNVIALNIGPIHINSINNTNRHY